MYDVYNVHILCDVHKTMYMMYTMHIVRIMYILYRMHTMYTMYLMQTTYINDVYYECLDKCKQLFVQDFSSVIGTIVNAECTVFWILAWPQFQTSECFDKKHVYYVYNDYNVYRVHNVYHVYNVCHVCRVYDVYHVYSLRHVYNVYDDYNV